MRIDGARRTRKNLLYYIFCCFCCNPPEREPEIPAPEITRKIEIITKKENIKLEISAIKPRTPDIHKYPYLCPICFQYYNKIYKAKCCGNYLCHICVSIMNQKIAEDENMKPNCLFCKSENMQVNDVEGSEPIKRYTDSPYIEKIFGKPAKTKSIFNHKIDKTTTSSNNKAQIFVSPKHSLNEVLERCKLKPPEEEKFMEINEKLKFPSISNYLTRVNKDFDHSRSDGFKGFKMVLKPERRSFEELPKINEAAANQNIVNPTFEKEMQELLKFKEEIDMILAKENSSKAK